MARAGINKAQVQKARDSLLARGITPSIDAVRAELGHTGSKTTINHYLRELAAAEPRPPMVELDEELQAYITSLAQRLGADAQASVAADRARLERQHAAIQHQRDIDQARYQELQKAHERLVIERSEALVRDRALTDRLQQLEGERQRLVSVEHHQQQLIDERGRQIYSLEEKHQQARESLNHYRQQHLRQREEELNRHEHQVQHLQQSLRVTQEQLSVKQEELSQLYRDLERLNVEQQGRLQEVRSQAQKLGQWSQRFQQLQETLHAEQAQSQSLRLQLSVQHEKARRYLLDHRQDRRDLRAQAQQLTDLNALLAVQKSNHVT